MNRRTGVLDRLRTASRDAHDRLFLWWCRFRCKVFGTYTVCCDGRPACDYHRTSRRETSDG